MKKLILLCSLCLIFLVSCKKDASLQGKLMQISLASNPTTGFNLKGDPCTKIDLETLCKGVGIKNVRVVDPYNLQETETAIKEECARPEPSVIISRRPCALLKYVKHPGPIEVDTNKCVGCKACMQIGCPAISVIDKKAKIDATLCVGCGVCGQLCKVGALPLRKDLKHEN